MTDYETLVRQMQALIGDERAPLPALANCAALLYNGMERVSWAGFYLLRGGSLLLGPFQGLHACVCIPIGKGVCGTAAAARKTQIVPDVHAFPGHIACDATSASEIVVPILDERGLLGVLDLDSREKGRFTDADERGLCALVRLLVRETDMRELVKDK